MKIIYFIDGLDEYEGDDADVAEIFGNASISQNVKICVSSRQHQVFEDAFAGRPGLRLQELTFPDIRRYIYDKLERHKRIQQLTIEEPVAASGLLGRTQYRIFTLLYLLSAPIYKLLHYIYGHLLSNTCFRRVLILTRVVWNL